MQVNNDRAMASGLTFRPIADTADDMIEEFKGGLEPQYGRGGFPMELEAELLAKWHAANG